MTSTNAGYSNEEKWDFVNPPRTQNLPTTRRRAYGSNFFRFYRDQNVWQNGAIVNHNVTEYSKRIVGTQITTSEGHRFRNNPAIGKSDIGGNFYTQKKYVTFGGSTSVRCRVDQGNAIFDDLHVGPILAIDPSDQTGYPGDRASSNGQLDALGTTAISRVKPTNPVGSLTTALVELQRDGLPHLFGSSLWEGKMSVIRAAGDEYLNKEFGWDPLRNDISGFIQGITHADDVIKRYKQGIGKPTRRRFDFTSTDTENTVYLGDGYIPFTGGYNSNQPRGYDIFSRLCTAVPSQYGKLSVVSRVKQRRWFSGAFTYFFPYKAGGKLGELAILAHQLGLDLSPDTVWAATPWTWAAGWFSNIGDVISNWSAFHTDGLVMTYGYMMEHTIVSNTYKLEGCHDVLGRPLPVSDVSFVIETKQRRGATPYGFGLTFDGLSGFQKSIIGALGLTKLFR